MSRRLTASAERCADEMLQAITLEGVPDLSPGALEAAKAAGRTLTRGECAFVFLSARYGVLSAAARVAGYAWPTATAQRMRRDLAVMAAIRAERLALMDAELSGIAVSTLYDLMLSRETPATVRLQAAKFTLESTGYVRKPDEASPDSSKPLADMTMAELAALVRQGERVIKEAQSVTIEHKETAKTAIAATISPEAAPLLD